MVEVGDIVLCTVDRIRGAVVFVKLENGQEGTIITSEIAPGRIRNLRNYVVEKKKIVCKVLRIVNNNIELSLRRVSKKEKEETLNRDKQKKSYIHLLKSILGEKADEIIKEISKKEDITDFFSKENFNEFEKLVGKENAEKIFEIVNNQKQKKSIIKKEIKLTTKEPNGIDLIKELLSEIKEGEVKYISAGNYLIKAESTTPKTTDTKIKEQLKRIEQRAKKEGLEFSVKEK